MRIYDIRFQIIGISLTILFSGLINITYGQEVNDTTTIGNNTIFEESLPPTTVGEREASLYTKISSPILTSDTKQDDLFQLRLFDSKTGNNITNVNYFLTISKGGKEIEMNWLRVQK